MEDATQLVFANGEIRTRVDLRSYRLVAIKKAAYSVAARCTAILGTPDEHILPMTFLFMDGTPKTVAFEIVREFFQVALDQELREAIGEETAPLRALILAQAFSKTDLVRRR
jgi:His-Xaa-Ser system protein HxsD